MGPIEVARNHHQSGGDGGAAAAAGQSSACSSLWVKVGLKRKIAKFKGPQNLKIELMDYN